LGDHSLVVFSVLSPLLTPLSRSGFRFLPAPSASRDDDAASHVAAHRCSWGGADKRRRSLFFLAVAVDASLVRRSKRKALLPTSTEEERCRPCCRNCPREARTGERAGFFYVLNSREDLASRQKVPARRSLGLIDESGKNSSSPFFFSIRLGPLFAAPLISVRLELAPQLQATRERQRQDRI
jgi:hypothetical protein